MAPKAKRVREPGAPWTFTAGLYLFTPEEIRQVMGLLHSGFRLVGWPYNQIKLNPRSLSRSQRREVKRMLEECADNDLLSNITYWFATKYYADDEELDAIVANFEKFGSYIARNPKTYPVEYEHAKNDWYNFIDEEIENGIATVYLGSNLEIFSDEVPEDSETENGSESESESESESHAYEDVELEFAGPSLPPKRRRFKQGSDLEIEDSKSPKPTPKLLGFKTLEESTQKNSTSKTPNPKAKGITELSIKTRAVLESVSRKRSTTESSKSSIKESSSVVDNPARGQSMVEHLRDELEVDPPKLSEIEAGGLRGYDLDELPLDSYRIQETIKETVHIEEELTDSSLTEPTIDYESDSSTATRNVKSSGFQIILSKRVTRSNSVQLGPKKIGLNILLEPVPPKPLYKISEPTKRKQETDALTESPEFFSITSQPAKRNKVSDATPESVNSTAIHKAVVGLDISTEAPHFATETAKVVMSKKPAEAQMPKESANAPPKPDYPVAEIAEPRAIRDKATIALVEGTSSMKMDSVIISEEKDGVLVAASHLAAKAPAMVSWIIPKYKTEPGPLVVVDKPQPVRSVSMADSKTTRQMVLPRMEPNFTHPIAVIKNQQMSSNFIDHNQPNIPRHGALFQPIAPKPSSLPAKPPRSLHQRNDVSVPKSFVNYDQRSTSNPSRAPRVLEQAPNQFCASNNHWEPTASQERFSPHFYAPFNGMMVDPRGVIHSPMYASQEFQEPLMPLYAPNNDPDSKTLYEPYHSQNHSTTTNTTSMMYSTPFQAPQRFPPPSPFYTRNNNQGFAPLQEQPYRPPFNGIVMNPTRVIHDNPWDNYDRNRRSRAPTPESRSPQSQPAHRTLSLARSQQPTLPSFSFHPPGNESYPPIRNHVNRKITTKPPAPNNVVEDYMTPEQRENYRARGRMF